ncbi:phosphoribosylformylglycinamidine synthase subunit PurL [Marine Group I thaumarchaeote]|uniref:Phosphoribosylformylglycinamidine synthase subunit PurL n=1 Tax=Marine Group I thaumarchaeote TaxID=2511932 RepID=A0A7K4MRD6_9ARCH|nr:phosphoribosylformylglycinamidine synthase subunit PurL [Marine Group I thaumarchaeote]
MLTTEETEIIKGTLGRVPNPTETHVFDAMWSEHCSYKSSKHWLKKLYTEGKHVISGPGENAGVVDIGDGDKIVFKMESHNHPSFIEPYQGAATGVGGIMRDIFTMGARPIANLNSLHFGSTNDKRVIDGVVKGISDYGNCVGIPTVSSKCYFSDCYTQNPLVNAMSVGYTNKEIFTSVPDRKGVVVYVGAKTGRDGIGGAIMASEEFEEGEDKRPTVQVGDPFYEKLLLEASLELFETGAVIAAQDMGAAGLTSSITEIAIKGNYGIEIDLSGVPLREEGMEPWEILLSESQERMLFILDPHAMINERVMKIFKKWDLDCFVIGKLTDNNNFKVTVKDKTVCDIPLKALEAPVLERRLYPKKGDINFTPFVPSIIPDFNMDWVWEQYDSQVMGNTIHGPQKDPAIVRIPNSKKGIAITTMSDASLCDYNPTKGIASIIENCYNKLKDVGAEPLGITNCLNFGNPENENVMYDFAKTVLSMAETCRKLEFPVVSGNVSFYNETSSKGIMPTPVIGGVGLML